MRFKDEKKMWYADTEHLARKLAKRSEQEVQEILDEHDIIQLRTAEDPDVNALGRILFPVVCLALIPIMAIKWIVTGDRYLDVYAKRFPWFEAAMDYCGIK